MNSLRAVISAWLNDSYRSTAIDCVGMNSSNGLSTALYKIPLFCIKTIWDGFLERLHLLECRPLCHAQKCRNAFTTSDAHGYKTIK